jgi:hypothetical protein
MSLNAKVRELEQKIVALEAKIQDLSRNTEESYKKPITVGGGSQSQGKIGAIDFRSGRGGMNGGPITWNETEIDAPYGTQPPAPTIGYNKHAHSRFSGGALIKDVIEIVEYEWGTITNKHSQGFLKSTQQPQIAKEANTAGKQVDKIGLLDLVFNADTQTWGCPAYEIDVRKCYIVERDEDGNIALDANGNEKKSPLFNDNELFSSIIWDKDGRNGQGCWRFLSVYASGDE